MKEVSRMETLILAGLFVGYLAWQKWCDLRQSARAGDLDRCRMEQERRSQEAGEREADKARAHEALERVAQRAHELEIRSRELQQWERMNGLAAEIGAPGAPVGAPPDWNTRANP